MFLSPISIILLIFSCNTYAKIYERCELARELKNFDLPEAEIPTWVCIAEHESRYNTSAMNPGSGDHGLFQISQLFWCSPPGDGYGCNTPCSKFQDDDIADDLQCIRRIYNEHTRISGNGYNAWVVYPLYCKNDTSEYVQGCFDQKLPITPDIPINATENEIPYEEVDEYGDGYQFPSLPNFYKGLLRTEQENSTDPFDFRDGYEFPEMPFSRISIHNSLAVKKNKYNLPKFPFSKESIHEFMSVQTPLEQTTEQVKQNGYNVQVKTVNDDRYSFPIFPSAKVSIHEFTTVHKPLEKTISSRIEQTNQDENNLFDKSANLNRYNFPTFPASKQSIHEFITVPKPLEKTISTNPIEETVFSKTKMAEQNENKLPVKPTQNNRYNFPVFPASKQSIHEFKTVQKLTKDNAYIFPKFPSSKQSIHEFILVDKPLEETVSSKSYQTELENKKNPVDPTYDKYSIHHFVPTASNEHKKNAEKTTAKYEEKHNSISSSKIPDEPFKQPMRNINLMQKLSEVIVSSNTEKKSLEEDSKNIFPSLPKKPTKKLDDLSNKISTTRKYSNLDSYSKFSTPSKLFTKFHSTSPTTLKPTNNLDSINLNTFTATSESNFKINNYKISTRRPSSTVGSSPKQKMVTSTQKLLTSDLKPLDESVKYYSKEKSVSIKKLVTTTQPPSTIKSKSSTATLKSVSKLQPLISRSSTLKPFPTISKLQVLTSDSKTIGNSFSTSKAPTTTSKPLTTQKLLFQYFNPQIVTHKTQSTFKSFQTTISKPDIIEKTPFERYIHTTTTKPFSKSISITASTSKPFLTHKAIQYFNTQTTSNKLPLTIKATSKPFTTKNTSLERVTQHTTTAKPFLKHNHFTTISQPSTTISTSKAFTTSKPFTTRKASFQYFNPQTTTRKTLSLLTTSNPFINKKTSFEHYTSHTILSKPFITNKSITTTPKPIPAETTILQFVQPKITTTKFSTLKPITTTSKSSTSQKKSFVPFTQRTGVTSTNEPYSLGVRTSTTKKPSRSRLITSLKPVTNFTYNQFSMTSSNQSYTSSTTSKPLSKQVTFAPDSFFSWIFGSQTLPPLIPPVRPPRPLRPGDRPEGPPLSSSLNQRPGPPRPGLPPPVIQRPRPGGLPRPSRPSRPLRPNFSERVHSSGTLNDSSESLDLLDERSEFKSPITGRPFGKRPAGSSSFASDVAPTTSKLLDLQKTEPPTMISFDKKLQQNERFTTISLVSSTTTAPITVTQKKKTALNNNKQFQTETSRHSSSVARKISNISEISKVKQNGDEHGVEVKLDDNFVFVRTRFGYRLFRNDKK